MIRGGSEMTRHHKAKNYKGLFPIEKRPFFVDDTECQIRFPAQALKPASHSPRLVQISFQVSALVFRSFLRRSVE